MTLRIRDETMFPFCESGLFSERDKIQNWNQTKTEIGRGARARVQAGVASVG